MSPTHTAGGRGRWGSRVEAAVERGSLHSGGAATPAVQDSLFPGMDGGDTASPVQWGELRERGVRPLPHFLNTSHLAEDDHTLVLQVLHDAVAHGGLAGRSTAPPSTRTSPTLPTHLAEDDHTLVLQVLHDAVAHGGLAGRCTASHADDERVPA